MEPLSSEFTDENKLGGFWIRAAAALIDMILAAAVISPVAILWQVYFVRSWRIWGTVVVLYAMPAVFTIAFWVSCGATPGKRWLHLKIVSADPGHPEPSLGVFIGRYAAYAISTLCFGLGYAWVGWDRRKQGFHDRLAGTVVLRTATGEPFPLAGLLGTLAAAVFTLIAGGGWAGWLWFRTHRAQLVAEHRALLVAAQTYGAQHTEQEIFKDAMVRAGACGGFLCQVEIQQYLREALRMQKATPAFCGSNVPPLTNVVATGVWRAHVCRAIGRTDSFCSTQMQAVQEHCAQDGGYA